MLEFLAAGDDVTDMQELPRFVVLLGHEYSFYRHASGSIMVQVLEENGVTQTLVGEADSVEDIIEILVEDLLMTTDAECAAAEQLARAYVREALELPPVSLWN